MVENRPAATVLSHLVLLLGVLIVAFPVYITFVASTHTAQEIVQNVPMSLLPGDNIVQKLHASRSSAGRPTTAHASRRWRR